MISYVPEYLKLKNRKMVFDLFVKHKTLSRVDVVKLTEMSFPTVCKAVDFMISRNIILECGEKIDEGRSGRKRQLLKLNSEAYCALALNFEGKYVDIALVDLAGNLLSFEKKDFSDFTDTKAQHELGIHLSKILETSTIPVLGIGIGLPGRINSDTLEILGLHDVNIDSKIPFKEFFSSMVKSLHGNIFIDNDANMACRGEIFSRNEQMSHQHLCFITLGTGFGASIMINGHIWQGSRYSAGEIGQQLTQFIDPNKPMDEQIVLLENRVNIQSINQKFNLDLLAKPELNDDIRKDIIEFLLPPLITTIFNMVCLLDIEQYVLSGFVNQLLGPMLCERLSQEVNRLLDRMGRSVQIKTAASPHVALIGSAYLVFEKTILDELGN